MQIPELNLFWLLVGAFIAAAATWALDAILIKRRLSEGDGEAIAALHEKVRQIEPLNKKLQAANSQIEDLQNRLQAGDSSDHVDALNAKVLDLESKLQDALAAEEEASRLAQVFKQELVNKDQEVGTLSAGIADLRQQFEQQQQGVGALRDQADEAVALRQSLADLKQRFDELQATAPSEAELTNARMRAEHAESEVERLRAEAEHSAPAALVAELESQVQDLQTQLQSQVLSVQDEFDREREGLLASISKLQSQLIESDEVVENFRTQLALANAALAEQSAQPERIQMLEGQLAERTTEVDRLSQRLPELEGLVADLQEELRAKSSLVEQLPSPSEVEMLRGQVAQLTDELNALRIASAQERSVSNQSETPRELRRDAGSSTVPAEVATLEERMNDLFGAVQASHREAAENRRALQEAMEQIRLLQAAVSANSTSTSAQTTKAEPQKKIAGGGSVRKELIESSELGELS